MRRQYHWALSHWASIVAQAGGIIRLLNVGGEFLSTLFDKILLLKTGQDSQASGNDIDVRFLVALPRCLYLYGGSRFGTGTGLLARPLIMLRWCWLLRCVIIIDSLIVKKDNSIRLLSKRRVVIKPRYIKGMPAVYLNGRMKQSWFFDLSSKLQAQAPNPKREEERESLIFLKKHATNMQS